MREQHYLLKLSEILRRPQVASLGRKECSFYMGQQKMPVFEGIHAQQLRFRRHDRASAFAKPRPPTRKKQRAYNRRMKKLEDEKARQSPPGSKAGPLREWGRNRWNQLLSHGSEETSLLPADDELYTYEDAILEDLVGNTAFLTSQPTPEPVYLGHRHREFYNRVADQMDAHREYVEEVQIQKEANLPVSIEQVPLPSDRDISKTLRAYRDRHGTRNKPIGIVKALQHLLKDLGLPVSAFGEYTYTTLMTCCQTPQEGRRIFQLMRDQNYEISAYSWSILVDIHAKLGDFEGCGQVLKEMASHGGHAPTQAAYTSLLAACYKICSDSGRVPHAIRAKAGDFGWRYWQEMRIVGIEPDVMAYGSIIRLCAARGLPERAIGLLEDMERFDVKPTTLCFTAALKAVAKSHEIANRYQRGTSRRNLKRESITAHHGKMARQIVVLAEAAEVQQDDGFISALMLCAGAAGDSATAKAILLASEVRKMDHLRTIGGSRPDALANGGDRTDSEPVQMEMGSPRDAGKLSDLIVMEGALNQPNSTTKSENEIATYGEREYGKDTRVISALVHACAQALNKNGIGTMWAGKENQGYLCENSLRLINTRWEPSYRDTSVPGVSSTKVGIGALRHVDEREKEYEYTPGKRKKFRGLFFDEDDITTIDDIGDDSNEPLYEDERFSNKDIMFLDNDQARYDLQDGQSSLDRQLSEIHNESIEEDDDIEAQPEESALFEKFVADTKTEANENGEEFDLTDEEARELFKVMQGELSDFDGIDGKGVSSSENEFEVDSALEEAFKDFQKFSADGGTASDMNEEQIQSLLQELVEESPFNDDTSLESELLEASDLELSTQEEGRIDDPEGENNMLTEKLNEVAHPVLADLSPGQLSKIEDLQSALPGMPLRRLRRILDTYEECLGHPSTLKLVPLLRETMPDYLSSGWLKRNNKQNAEFALKKAADDGIVDSSLLNSMLEVKANSGSLNEAIDYHKHQFSKHNMTPSPYSDRMLIQMLISNKRLTMALEVKERIENEGRSLDIASYGSLVQFYSRHQQLGSALMVLKECISKHGTAPSEAYVSDLRTLCRRKDVEDIVGLVELVGEDPTEWLRHGEKYLKREKSKKGRRYVQHAQNRLL